MNMIEYAELKTRLCHELEDIMDKNSIGMAEVEIIDKLTHSIKSINAILKHEEESDGRWNSVDAYGRGRTVGRRDMQYANMEAHNRGIEGSAESDGEHYWIDKFHPGEVYKR